MHSSLWLPWTLIALLPLAGCDQKNDVIPPPTVSSVATPSVPLATTGSQAEPDTDELHELVSPIALFPDNLLALVLAASTAADDVASANAWRLQNTALKGTALTQAVDAQLWPAAVKALTGFPDVLSQMAQNLPWTRALGSAWTQSPSSVMDAVQVLRQRAARSGALKSTPQQKVETVPGDVQPAGKGTASTTRQTITIQPAHSGVVYVPVYNTVVYGTPPVSYYPGYVSPPAYSTGDLVMTGLISFTAGVVAGEWSNNRWGWNNWGVHWGASPVVVYNHQTYVNRTVINRNHINWHPPYFGPGPVLNPQRFSRSGPTLPGRAPVFNSAGIHPPVFHPRYNTYPDMRRYGGAEPLRRVNGAMPYREPYRIRAQQGGGPDLHVPARTPAGSEVFQHPGARELQGTAMSEGGRLEQLQSLRSTPEHHRLHLN